MIKEKTVKFRNVVLIFLLIIWFLMLFVGVGVAVVDLQDVNILNITIDKIKINFYDVYIKQEYKLYITDITQIEIDESSSQEEEVEASSKVYDIKAIYLSLYLVLALMMVAYIVFQQIFRKKLPSAIYLLGLLPFIVSCCICIRADLSYSISLKGNGSWGFCAYGKHTYLPVLGDWLSAIISLAMFGFSWLCNHWVKQGVPMPQPKERVPKERKKEKPKTDKQRIDELEKRLQELEGSKQD